MTFTMWRGVVGIVHPTRRPGAVESLIRMLPDGIGVSNLHLNVREGSKEEFQSAIAAYEENVAEFAADGVDVIHPMGAPPFMLLGYKGEMKLIERWERKYKKPIFTSGDRKSTRLNSSHIPLSRMPSSA